MKCVIHGTFFGERMVVSVNDGAVLMAIIGKAKTVRHEYNKVTGHYEYVLRASSTETTFTLVSDSEIKYPESLAEIVKLKREDAPIPNEVVTTETNKTEDIP